MKLHVFNPEHDLMLAYDRANVTLPHSVQEMRMNLGFLPSLWADDGDCVLVDDVPYAVKALRQARGLGAEVLFVSGKEAGNLLYTQVVPWGWDQGLVTGLLGLGIDPGMLPSRERLSAIRDLSHRGTAIGLLRHLRDGNEGRTCGEGFLVGSMDEVRESLSRHGEIVVKAPWSGSGRGLRYVSGARGMDPSIRGWIANTIAMQGGVVVEPRYPGMMDFAMEFHSDGEGGIEYRGLSVFATDNGHYRGNVVAHEETKLSMVARHIPMELLLETRERIVGYLSALLRGRYLGPLGIDMMVVGTPGGRGFLLHPCVEMNLRMTMGHVAGSLRVPPAAPDMGMYIRHCVNYRLRLEPLEKGFVMTV